MTRLTFAITPRGESAAGDGYLYDRLNRFEAGTLAAIDRSGLPLPNAAHYRYIDGRRFEADFAWLSRRGDLPGVLLECQGGVYTRKAHGSVTGVLRDIERGNLAASHGWLLIRIASGHLKAERWPVVVEQLRAALRLAGVT